MAAKKRLPGALVQDGKPWKPRKIMLAERAIAWRNPHAGLFNKTSGSQIREDISCQ